MTKVVVTVRRPYAQSSWWETFPDGRDAAVIQSKIARYMALHIFLALLYYIFIEILMVHVVLLQVGIYLVLFPIVTLPGYIVRAPQTISYFVFGVLSLLPGHDLFRDMVKRDYGTFPIVVLSCFMSFFVMMFLVSIVRNLTQKRKNPEVWAEQQKKYAAQRQKMFGGIYNWWNGFKHGLIYGIEITKRPFIAIVTPFASVFEVLARLLEKLNIKIDSNYMKQLFLNPVALGNLCGLALSRYLFLTLNFWIDILHLFGYGGKYIVKPVAVFVGEKLGLIDYRGGLQRLITGTNHVVRHMIHGIEAVFEAVVGAVNAMTAVLMG